MQSVKPFQAGVPKRILQGIMILVFLSGFTIINPIQSTKAKAEPAASIPGAVENKPLFASTPALNLNVPSNVMIGSQFTFTATFDNIGADPGYGPFIDLIFPVIGADGAGAATDDGITFVGADYLGASIPVSQIYQVTFPDDDGAGPGNTGCVQHPVAVRPANDPPVPADPIAPRPYTVCGIAGNELVTILLPFGSFVPTQPAADITITAQMSNLADLSVPLGITGQAGFRFGNTAINDFCCSPYDATLPFVSGGVYDTTTFTPSNVTPQLITLSKAYIGPENETSTGPSFPRQYEITVDIAQGQTVNNLVIHDALPSNIQFVSLDSVTPADTIGLRVLPSTSSPGGNLSVTIPAVTGGTGTSDARVLFTFYVDRAVSGTPIIPPSTGVQNTSSNTADTSGIWVPIDTRDQTPPPPAATAICTAPCVTIQDQSIVTQKGVSNITDASNSPGDVLEYTIDFQISDFFGFQNVDLTDVISDGQHFDSSYTPRLTLSGNPSAQNLAAVNMAAANVDVTCNYTGAVIGAQCDSVALDNGQTTIVFNLSDELAARFAGNDQLLGGCVDPASANNPPVCSGPGSYNDSGTTGTITFRTVIQQDFTDNYPSGDTSVDHGDILENDVNISGEVLNVAIAPVAGLFSGTGNSVTDDSGAEVDITFGALDKRLFAVNGSTTIPTYLTPGDIVTYRLTYSQPTSDFETTVLTDFLPLPIFSATELTSFISNQKCEDLSGHPDDVPLAGEICLGPNDTYHSLNSAPVNEPNSVVVPIYVTSGTANSLTITYPTYDSVSNHDSVIDILFSLTVESDPFADGLFLTNQANSQEGTTNAGDQALNDIVQIRIGEPVLRTAKTAVSTDHIPGTDVAFSPNQSLMTQFAAPGGSGAPFSGTISSTSLSTDPDDTNAAFDLFNSTMSGVDGGDLIKYGIVIENRGHSNNGAFDIVVSDILPPGMTIPTVPTGLNLQIYRGDGTVLSFEVVDFGLDGELGGGDDTVVPGTSANASDIFAAGKAIRVVDPTSPPSDAGKGAFQLEDATNGKNVVVITYDLTLQNTSGPATSIINTASLHGYSSTEGGPNFLPEPVTEDAEIVTASPSIVKTLTSTETTATGNNAATEAVVGELVTYTLTTKFFEQSTSNAQIVDTLDAGLAFVDVVSITASNPDTDAGGSDTGLTSSVMTFDAAGLCTNCVAGPIPPALPSGSENPLVVNNGNQLTFNLGNISNNDVNNAVEENIIIVYRAVVLNVAGNQAGTQLNNSAVFTWTGGTSTVSALNVTVVEPNVNITKDISPTTGDAGDPFTYTITVSGATGTDAFEVTLDDVFPALVENLLLASVTDTASLVTSSNFDLTGNTLTTVTPFDMPASGSRQIVLTFTGTIAYAATPGQTITNNAVIQWSSRDGIVTDRSLYNTDSDERTGNGSPSVNDYTRADGADLLVNTTSAAKTLIITSESFTSDGATPPEVAIGEIIRYRLEAPIPEGTSPNFQIRDFLPTGLIFLDDNTAKVAFVANGTGITSTAVGAIVPAISGCTVATSPASLALPCTLADGSLGSDSSTATDPDAYTTSSDLYIKFGNVVNNDNDADVEYVVVEFNALIDNHSGAGRNIAGNTRDNMAASYINGTQNGPFSSVVTVKILEPSMSVSKTALPASGDAGDTITYSLVFSNASGVNNTTAYDVLITDTIPSKMTASLGSMTVVQNPLACAVGQANTSSGNNVHITYTSVPTGCTVSVTYTATLNTTVTAAEVLANDVDLTYTSLPGPNGTTVNSTGSSTPGVTGATNGERDYALTTSANVTVNPVLPVKSIVSTSALHTSESGTGTNANPRLLAIGEVIRYRLAVTIPEGTQSAFTITDTLPAGFTYAGNPTISFIDDALMTLSAGDLSGADNDALPPTFVLPLGHINVVSPPVVTFSLGDIINNDSDANAEMVVIDFDVLVNNTANNNNTNLKNNTFTVTINSILRGTSNNIRARIVEPLLDIVKSANDSTWRYDQAVTFTLNVSHTAASAAEAFEIVVTDTIPSSLTYVPGSITAPVGWTLDDSAAPTLTWTCTTANTCSLALAGTAALTYQVSVDSPVTDPANALHGNATAVNTTNMTWTSLPGNNNPGDTTGERDGSGGVINDHFDSSNHTGSLESYYSLGNRVWFDTNNNGQIDFASELGVNGVAVQLYSASDLSTVLATDTTSNGGYYLFDDLLPGDYVVVLPSLNFADGAVLDDYWSSGTTINGSGIVIESPSPALDADGTPTDSDDNGYLSGGIVIAQAVTLGPTGLTEPLNETDLEAVIGQGTQPDGRANMTVDFGFYKTVIGDIVWLEDVAVDGAYAVGETLINGASVTLRSTNGNEIPVGADGILGTSDDAAGGVTTGNIANGWANGVYAFSGLPAGSYVVQVVGPTGTLSTVDTSNPGDTTAPNNNVNNNDNGVGILSNIVSANTFIMTPGTSGTVANSNGTTTNNTIDFGFTYSYALGNRVWYDTNNNSQIDFASELGVDGVTVQLYAAVGGVPSGPVLATDTTINGGYYLFDGLFPGDYVVVLPATNFTGAGVLTGWWSSATLRALDGTISETVAALTESNTDSDDNGTRQTAGAFNNAVISSAVTLGPTGLTEPTGEHLTDVDINETGTEHQGLQPDGRANMTVDFGFYRVSVGNLVFGDIDKNGLYVGGTDVLLSGVTVELFTGNGATFIASTTTNPGGIYQFSGLPEGSYVIRVTTPAGMLSTIDSGHPTDNNTPNDNSDDNDNGDGIGNGVISSESGLNAVYLDAGVPQLHNVITPADGTTYNPTMDFGFSYLYALGNRLWFDTDNDSVIDASEVGVMDGVEVQLWAADSSGTPTGAVALATDTTATSGGNSGYYYFPGLEAGNYVVVIPATEFVSGGNLYGYWSSATTRLDSGVITESTAPIPNTVPSDIDDNGTRQVPSGPANLFDNAVLSGLVTLGPGPVEPSLETDIETGTGQPDLQANLTVDFGFYTIRLGNLVWNDLNNDGLALGETGLSNVTLELWSGDGLTQLVATPASVNTDGSGNYTFTGLPQGNYILRIPASEFNPGGTLRDYVSSTGGITPPYPFEPSPNAESNTTDSDDNGTAIGGTPGVDGTYNTSLGLGGYVQSSVFSLTPNAENAATSNNAMGLTSEPRIDFGVYVNAQTDLSITKTSSPTYYIPGGTLNYTVVVINKGPSDVVGAIINDALPPQIASWAWTCDAGNPATSNCTGALSNSAAFTDTIDLLQGESVTYHVVAVISAAPTGRLDNTVTVTNPVTELFIDDNEATEQDELASLQVTKDDSQTIISAGNTITYQIVVTNNGTIPLTSVIVSDTLPSDLTFVSAVPTPTTQVGNVLTWSGISPLTNLAVGASTTINVTATVVSSPSATITNVVNVVDTVTNTMDTDDDVDAIASVPNNNITKSLVNTDAVHTTGTQVTIGELLTYEVIMSVPSGSMTNAILVDTPQNGLAFVDLTSLIVSNPDTDGAGADTGLSSSVMTFDAGGVCTNCADGLAGPSNPVIGNNGRTITFDFDTLTNNGVTTETVTIRYTVVVLDILSNQHSLGTTLANDVTWSWDGNNSVRPATLPSVSVVEPEMTIDKNAQPNTTSLGSPITFTIDIGHSNVSSADAFDVVVTDILPPGLAYIPGSFTYTRTSGTLLQPPVFNYNPGTTTLTFVWDEFQLNQSAQLSFQATFVGPAPVQNSASMEWTSLEIDPSTTQRSIYNSSSTERWYDPAAPTGLNDYGVSDSVTITVPGRLPRTGFAPDVVTQLPAMPEGFSYAQTDLTIEIPRLGIKLNIVGVPFGEENWDLTWLAKNAGWLEGSAFPTHAGNSAITAHAYLADGTAGPFANLNSLRYGDQIIVHFSGQKYIYEVRQNLRVNPNTMSVLKHEEVSWLTLITCQTYNEQTDDYVYRIAVRAVLVKVVDE